MSHDTAITLMTVNFPALSDANYSEWVIRMEAELVRKDLWDVIELPAPMKDLKMEKEIAAWHESQLAARDDVSEPMSAWIGRVKEMVFRLEDIGVKVDDEDRILALTNGLDDSYEAFVISLDATPTAQLTLEYVVNRLLNEEMRRGNTQAADRNRNGQTALHMGMKSSGHIKAFCREEPMRRSDDEERGRANFAVSELVDLGSVEIGRVL
ncbi:hypothetical protein CERSUDRAFT_92698 [Gelatoporia subvermispora B]|uniref:DUF4219 domain-containing protein n=1 Tax=Ceriporiopsis subvermispora (strain B) TaxID=914234 RepID=M2QT34_CERS8|nr:hypothetical protein CERSUDRAFT_92698 [Gelatoporia subvermispora B]